MSVVYRPGHRYQGADGDVLFAIYSEHGTEFVTSRGTRVPMDEAERVYAPLTPLDTVPADKVRDLAAAIREALDLPTPATSEAWKTRDRIVSDRAAYLVGALATLASGEDTAVASTVSSVRAVKDLRPVTYETEDGAK